MLSKVYGGVVVSLDPSLVEIEVEHKNGFPGFDIVGLPDAAIKESKERIFEAIRNSGFDLSFRRIVCNLAPANLKKSGTYLDLPLALGLLQSSGLLLEPQKKVLAVGELGFQGIVRPVNGILSIALLAKEQGFKALILPHENLEEAQAASDLDLYPVKDLKEAALAFEEQMAPALSQFSFSAQTQEIPDFSEVKGQALAKRALEIAAAGFHNLILLGSPGVGKTMLARRLPGILPPLTLEESVEITRIYSVSPDKGGVLKGLVKTRPFRSPHHTSSEVAITGGGSIPKPGEISLAHKGVLFFDELPEFKRAVFEVLREPLEERYITVSRSEKVQTFPADFLFLASMNPCPCGYALHPIKPCQCHPTMVKKYFKRVSGPILDRVDLQIQVNEVKFKEIDNQEEPSSKIRERVMVAREIQKARFKNNKTNSRMSNKEIEQFCKLSDSSKKLIQHAMDRLGFSMRGYTRVLKTARTIADLEGKEGILEDHLLEALQYRNIEKRMGELGLEG